MSDLMVFDVDREVLMISSREIAEATGKKLHHVNRDIQEMLNALGHHPVLDNDDFKGFLFKYKHYNGRNVIDEVLLNKELTMCLITGYDVKQRMKVIKRVKELEEAQHKLALPDFTDPVAAARAWADEVEQKLLVKQENERLTLVNKQLAPKAAVCDAIVKNDMHRTASEVAKPLGMSAVKLNRKLSAVGVYDLRCRRRVFSQWFIDEGYGEMRVTHDGYEQAVFTAKGQVWIT
ncbi:Rha family transcriptional regulator [Escherichia coli]|uniref:Rha family transcriptional regulator n=1 Tax=Escherichia coli TaxID=562 RepID=UPI001E2C16F4|nr:phage antirepressor KilAC domain-containing protein [Escherichia coli]